MLITGQVGIADRDTMSVSAGPFRMFRYPKGAQLERADSEISVIIFLISGKIRIVCNDMRIKVLGGGTVMLLPKHSCTYGVTLTDCDFVACAMPEGDEERDLALFQTLSARITEDFEYDFDTLEIHPLIGKFLSLLEDAFEHGIVSDNYMYAKRAELHIYVKRLYDNDSLARFFYPLLGGHSMSFKDFVISNYRNYTDVPSFAAAANMSVSTFTRAFRKAFGTTVYKWLNARRAEYIYKDIVMTEMSFAEIADRYGFSSQAYLVYYCRRHFGVPPKELRNSLGGG